MPCADMFYKTTGAYIFILRASLGAANTFLKLNASAVSPYFLINVNFCLASSMLGICPAGIHQST